MTDEIFQLADGRMLGYTLYGPGDGQPILYYHGTPSSRLEPSLVSAFGIDLEDKLVQYRIRLIAVDRPGIGISSFNPPGNFVSFAIDVAQLLDHLALGTTKVLCWSGGGPFALAMANHFPGRISAVYIIAGFTVSFGNRHVFKKLHGNKMYFGAARYFPAILRFGMDLVVKKGAKRPIPQKISGLDSVDHSLLTDPRKLSRIAATTLQEACRQGSRGAVNEARLYFENFGYSLRDISQPVHYWWGTSDKAVTRLHAEAVEQQVPNVRMYYKQGEGHLSIYIHYLEEVLHTLAEQRS